MVVLKDWQLELCPSAKQSFTEKGKASVKADSDEDSSLPRIPLPTFSGDILSWESFRDRFRSLIHDSKRLSKVRKLEYLKSSLTGDAAKMLERTPITEAGYDGAWSNLMKRYENKHILTTGHLRRLVNSEPVVNGRSSDLKRLLDDFAQARESLSALGKPVAQWDDWFVFLFTEKLDPASRLAWEVTFTERSTCPSYAAVETFFETRVHALYASQKLETAASSNQREKTGGSKSSATRTRTALPVKATTPLKGRKSMRQCPLCRGEHHLNYCSQFKALSARDRKAQAMKVGVCLSCLKAGHFVADCPSTFRCLLCSKEHHTLLHEAFVPSENEESGSTPPQGISTTSASVNAISAKRLVLLATARVRLVAHNGHSISVRALLDQGADVSFVSEWVTQALRLKRRPTYVALSGFQGRSVGVARHEVETILTSDSDPSFSLPMNALVTREVIPPTPSRLVSEFDWDHLRELQLADEDCFTPTKVDILLGADVCYALMGETRQGPRGTPSATHTPFGWVVFGPVSAEDVHATPTSRKVLHTRVQDTLEFDLRRFWELEEFPVTAPGDSEDTWCESMFLSTHKRDRTGRYTVRLPFRQNAVCPLGASRPAALRTLLSNERRQQKDERLRGKYADFLHEYLQLGHMEPASGELSTTCPHYYLPHHAVWKGEGAGSKIRVVFNASCATSTGKSLNDLLMSGPKLQSTLWSVLTKWRLFQFAFSTDIVKMFRQVLVHPNDRDWQRILWRSTPEGPLETYRLVTVTYGTAPAPYLALRVLRQLAVDEGERFPLGAQVLLQHSYVDDLLAGGCDLDRAREVQRQVIEILKAGGFQLSKWATNHSLLDPSETEKTKLFQEPEIHGALGLIWTPSSDTLSIRPPSLQPFPDDHCWTKRRVLSELARLFDPMGWAAPVLIRGKILMQDLWLAGVGWDDQLPSSLSLSWTSFRASLTSLGHVRLPRWTFYHPAETLVEYHGFCDASERAYCAAVYLRVHNTNQGTTCSNLLVARTKVAPVKVVSVPRLELCGALLLARLLKQTVLELSLSGAPLVVWSDSSVVIAWTRSHATRWKPFVAHRVAEIQRLLPETHWRHVRSADNPADLATRGLELQDLQTSNLWWQGPPWLIRNPSEWPESTVDLNGTETSEQKSSVVVHTVQEVLQNELFLRYSSFTRLLRVTALLRRFGFNLRTADRRRSGGLSSVELSDARILLCHLSQLDTFSAELNDLRKGRPVKMSSPLSSLNPFLDQFGLLRVGGRLGRAELSADYKHPVIISRHSTLAVLLVGHAHLATLHGGFTLTRSFLGQGYWIPQNRNLIKQITRRCLRCLRFRGATGQQQLGELPAARLEPSKPFLRSGVDYAGPIMVRTTKGRGHKAYKGYLAVFVCLCTKAVHLEVVSDLTSTTFIASFRRFVARRGHCAELLSDNATTFRGADKELRSLFRGASDFFKEVSEVIASDGTHWSFIPPYSPHFGGLWEAAVKSAKYHLRRIIGEHTLTYEELSTLTCQIEACLNSRPLTSLSDDPSDFTPLTPGHFLVGAPLVSIPEPCAATLPVHGLTRWKLLSNLRDHFWYRWTKEYLHQLQQLPKWRRRKANWKVGMLVLAKDDLLPPTKWPLARILEVHPGNDGLVRVVTIRTATKTAVRSIGTLCPLPDGPSADSSTDVNDLPHP
ncbi:MAG TPA: DUF1759 domain-containing protein [Arsenophonus apicola]